MWACFYVGVFLCGRVFMWACFYVGVFLCGRVLCGHDHDKIFLPTPLRKYLVMILVTFSNRLLIMIVYSFMALFLFEVVWKWIQVRSSWWLKKYCFIKTTPYILMKKVTIKTHLVCSSRICILIVT